MMQPAGDVAIVGAGISGVTCARQLAERGLSVHVFDKGRRVGGRTAMRRLPCGDAVDHGAQYFTVRSPAFRRFIDVCLAEGVVAEWRGTIVSLRKGRITRESSPQTRYVGVPDMTQLAERLARDLPIQLGTQIGRVWRDSSGWWLAGEFLIPCGPFRALVCTPPAQQAVGLLVGESVTRHAEPVIESFAPCWATLVQFPARLPIEFDGAFVEDSALRWIARDGSKPGRPPGERWVLHANPDWSRNHLELSPPEIVPLLLNAFWQSTGIDPVPCAHSEGHRWRLRAPDPPCPEPCLFDPQRLVGLCGDWCGGPRVEGAFLSGLALADRLIPHLVRET